ncbi:MAG: alanine racemase [Tumebacillaceae bacterium]
MFVRPTWAEINLDYIEHNIQENLRTLPPGTQVMAVVKANGYGHGSVMVARKALLSGATYLAVSSVDEAIELRDEGILAPILVLGFTPPSRADILIGYDLTQTVYQYEMLEALNKEASAVGKQAKVHVKVDTGMGRLGFTAVEETVDFLKQAVDMPGIFVEGMFTHFATADEEDTRYAQEQIMRWNAVRQACEEEGLQIPLLHISNSAAILQFSNCGGNMVRLGISMYGYYPSDEVSHQVPLKPAMRLVSEIVHLKQVPPGTKISYGATFETKRKSWIATVPVGYADGYSRSLSNKGHVLLHGVRVPVIGRVCMDQLMLDVTDVPEAKLGDQVVLYGHQGEECISLEEVAGHIGTINYEVICALGRRVPRCYLENGVVTQIRNM